MDIIKAILLGGFFGFSVYIVGATSFSNISKMLRLEDLILAKIIMFAIGVGSVLLSISVFIGVFNFSHISIKAMNLGVVIGGIIFGAGFAVAGTCPGTCVGAAASKQFIKMAFTTILGGLLGAFTFTMTYGFFNNIGLFNIFDFGKMTLFLVSDKYPAAFNFGYIGLFVVGILFMIGAYFIPRKIL